MPPSLLHKTITGFALLALSIFFAVQSIYADDASTLDGAWKGDLNIPNQALPIVLHIEVQNSGQVACKLDSPSQNVFGLESNIESFEANFIEVNIPAIKGRYEASVDLENRTMSGTWIQGPTQLPLNLEHSIPSEKASKAVPQAVIDSQLQSLSSELEALRETHHIPGMGLAIVKDGQVIYSQGFGHARLESNTPVTEETNFMIGSSTKSFSSTLVAMLVDGGTLDWATPVSDLLPQLELKVRSDEESDAAKIEDLLSHRSGFPRMSMLWVTPDIGLENILEKASVAKPTRPLGKAFQYNNVLYAAGAVAAANSVESDWRTLIQQRIFDPLEMKNSYVDSAVAETENLAFGYKWSAEDEKFEKLDVFHSVDNVAPSGAINSNLVDMTKWIRFLLAKGKAEGSQLVSESALEETWSPRISISPQMSYGLGWFIENWNGKKVVHHGGNIYGYACQVALIPEENIGLVYLANVTMTPLQSQVTQLVWESVLTEKTESAIAAETDAPQTDYSPLIGEYIANFGPFKNTVFTVQEKEGKLAIDVPGQMLYTLKAPDLEGKWYFEMTDKIALSFEQETDKAANAVDMFQSGMTFHLPRKTESFEDSSLLSRSELKNLIKHEAHLANFEALGSIKAKGIIKLPNTGLEGTVNLYLSKKYDQVRIELDFGDFGNTQHIYSQGRGVMKSSFNQDQIMNTQMIEELKIDQGFLNLFETFEDISTTNEREIKGKSYYEVTFSGADKSPIHALIEKESGQIARTRARRVFDSSMPAFPLQTKFHDYRDVSGVQFPHKITISDNQNGSRVLIIKEIETVEKLDPTLFDF